MIRTHGHYHFACRMDVRGFCGAMLALLALPVEAVQVLTHHNDNFRTGGNLQEFVLTTSNVNTGQFGKLFTRAVDAQTYAQPLYVQGVTISNKLCNVVYVCTESNSVYAFDADDVAASNALWQVNLGPPVPIADLNNCSDLTPVVGITATPVIDRVTGTIYIGAKSKESGNYYHKLHALDILTGQEKFGGPVVVQGYVLGSGSGNVGGTNTFDALHHHNRPGLLLLSNVVYLAYGSHCDWGPYHGWVFGYNATNLQRVAIFNTTPNGGEGAIWSCGMGPAADAAGNIYVMTGNGTFDKNTNGLDLGDSFIKLSTSNGALTVADWFTPHDQAALNGSDADLGSGGPVLIPGTNRLVGVGKSGTMYVLDSNRLGGYVTYTSDTNIVQEFSATAGTCCIGPCPVYWSGPTNQFLFQWSGGDVVKAYKFGGSTVQTNPLAVGTVTQGRAGGTSLSANGNVPGTGIIWGIESGGLHAYEAASVAHELWNSQQLASRDALGGYVKFCSPTIANGKVYAPTGANKLVVYGLLAAPYDIWQKASFTAGELTNALVIADTADPDGDGIPNLLEYAFGLNPKVADQNGLPVVSLQNSGGSNYLTVTYDQVLFATDISYTVEVSGDLVTWDSGPGYTVQVGAPIDNGDGTETVTVRDATPMGVATRRFIRLHINRVLPPQPQATLTASSLNPGGPFWVLANVANVSTIAHVDFWVDGSLFRRENVAPYSLFGDDGTNPTTGTLPAGAHSIIAKVYADETTLVVTSPAIIVTE